MHVWSTSVVRPDFGKVFKTLFIRKPSSSFKGVDGDTSFIQAFYKSPKTPADNACLNYGVNIEIDGREPLGSYDCMNAFHFRDYFVI